jgi:hypothetical protein
MDADSIARSIDAAVIAELERFGIENGIPPVHWEILAVSETILFDGTPDSERAADACIEWANALGMSRYEFESQEGVESWHLDVGPWSLEISSGSERGL